MPGERKKRFSIVKILGIASILLIAAIIAIPFVIDANQFRPKLELELTSALGREVKVGNLKLSILSGSVAADDIAIADTRGEAQHPTPTLIAMIYAALGENDEAMVWPEEAYQERAVGLVLSKVDPGFDPLRDDPRFQALLRNEAGEGQSPMSPNPL